METGFLSFFVVKLKQIHIDKGITAGYSTNILQCHPVLYATVTKCMIHSPCGPEFPNAPCMVKGKCSKHYPKDFCPETSLGQDGYPEYARPNDGRTYINSHSHTCDNRDVIPYNPYLSARYNCHINVEICTSVKVIKYIHKYIYKGHNRATLGVGEDIDEILEHIGSCYIGPSEAFWHIAEFPMHEEKPSIYRLPVHLQDQQTIYFGDNDDLDEVVEHDAIKKTALMEWFTANQTFPATKEVSYLDFLHHFVWNKKNRKWSPHQRGNVIGRMYFVHPSGGERFHLRLLLINVKGAKSWEDIRRFQGILHPTFNVACLAR